jgi:hypothetical protein
MGRSPRFERIPVFAAPGFAMAESTARDSGVANSEVSDKAVRRRFTATYKRRILQEADQCGPGGIAALLRREDLSSIPKLPCLDPAPEGI